MAKQQIPKDNSNQEIKKLLEGLYKVIQITNSSSKEQVKINRELLKVMSLLEAGFATNQADAKKLIDDVSDGIELTDEYARKWAKTRGAAKKDLDDIIDKFRQLEKLDVEAIDNAKDYIDLLQERYDIFHDELDLSSRLLKSHMEIAQAVRDSKRAAGQLGGSMIDVNDTVEKLVRRKVDLGGMFNDMFDAITPTDDLIGKIQNDIQSLISNTSGSVINLDLNFNPLTSDLDEEISEILKSVDIEKTARLNGLTEFFDKNKKLQTNLSRQIAAQMSKLDLKVDIDTGDIMSSTGILKRGTLEYQKVIDKLDKTVGKKDIGNQVQGQFKEIVNLIGLGIDRTEEQTTKLNQLLTPLDLASKLLIEQFETRSNDLDLMNAEIHRQKNLYKLLAENLHLLSTAENIVQRIGSGFDYINAVLPAGVGDFLGLSKVSASLMDSHKKGVQSFVDSLEKGEGKSAAIQSYLKSFGPTIKLALNPMTLLVAGGILLFKMLDGIVDKYKQMSQEMKTSLLQSSKLLQVQLDTLTSQKNQFATLQDIQDVQSEMIGSSGKVFDLMDKSSKELSINLIEAGKAFGYGATEAVKLHKVFKNIGANDDLAKNLQQNLGLMSEMAGLSPQIVAQDMIDGAEVVSTYFAGLPDKAAKAAIQVRRMGLSLQKAGEIAQEMLNLEGFMTNMYELQAMSGGGIDFSGAFEKGLMGDIEGMTKDIMDNIGTTTEYNKMDYLTRTKIAKTLGMSVDELGKSVRLREQMSGLGEKEKSYLDANLSRMGDISNLSQEEIRNRLQQLQSTDRLNVAWDKIKGTLVKALIPLAESFADAIDAISPLLDIVIGAFKVIGLLIKPLVPLAKGLLAPFKLLGDLLEGITSRIDSWADSLGIFSKESKGVHGILDLLGKAVYYIGAGISTWFVGKKLLGGLGMIKSETKGLGSLIPSIGSIFSSVFSSSEKVVGESSKAMAKTNKSALSDISTAAVETAKTVQVESSKSAAKSGFVNAGMAKSSFKLIGAIAASTFAKMAVGSASTWFGMRKDGEEQMSEMSANTFPMFEALFAGGGSLLTHYLGEGLERVFTKRIEKSIEGKLEEPIKKAAKSFGSLDGSATNVFSKIGEKGKSMISKLVPKSGIFKTIVDQGKSVFGKIGDIGSKVLPSVFNPMSKSFDAFAGKVNNTEKSITEQVTQIQEVLPEINKTEIISETVNKKKDEVIESTTKTKEIKQPKQSTQKPKSALVSIFDSFASIIERGSKLIKTVLGDIVKFASTAMKDLSSGIGSIIKNLLKGIGDGLSSFKTSAIKGAASLVIVSGALWITSKALQNFASVKWEDVGKGIVTLGGLVAVGMILGKSTGQILLGSIGIAALGAALIPAAFALNEFNKVEWGSLGKAAVALVGLGVVGSVLGGAAPAMLLGAVGIAAVGAAIIPLAYAMKMFNDIEWSSLGKAGSAIVGFGIAASAFGLISPLILAGSLAIGAASISLIVFTGALITLTSGIESINVKPLGQLTDSMMKLTSISITQLFGLSGAITSIGSALLAFNTMSLVGSIEKMFGGDAVKDLERLAKLADPLYLINEVILELGNSLMDLSNALANIDLSNLTDFKKVENLGIDTKVQKHLEPMLQQPRIERDNTQVRDIKISPVQPQVAKAETPKKEVVGQDRKIGTQFTKKDYPEQKLVKVQPQFTPNQVNQPNQNNNQEFDIYNRPGQENKTMELLLRQLVQLTELIARKDPQIILDGQKVNQINKKYNNSVG